LFSSPALSSLAPPPSDLCHRQLRLPGQLSHADRYVYMGNRSDDACNPPPDPHGDRSGDTGDADGLLRSGTIPAVPSPTPTPIATPTSLTPSMLSATPTLMLSATPTPTIVPATETARAAWVATIVAMDKAIEVARTATAVGDTNHDDH